MNGSQLLDELIGYVGFTPADVALLVAARPLLEPSLPDVVDAFYVAIEQQPRARAVFADGAQIERQKKMLATWLVGLFGGVYDTAYFDSRARIGYAHVRIGLDPALVIAAMNVVRSKLHDAVELQLHEPEWRASRRREVHAAIDRICDIDTAIMVETYRDDYAVRIRGSEKLAALGQVAGTIGHELRNPLAVMETSLHLLRGRMGDDPKVVRHLERLAAQVDLCASIVRDLMDLARDKPPNPASTHVASVLEDALADLPAAALVRRVVLAPPDATCFVDPLQLRQLIVNLVTNAIQAASSGAAGVEVTLTHGARELTVIVEDDGPGISDEVRPRLFEPLFTTRMRGVGFGLAFCRRVAELHGGQIRAINRPEGGARFEATLLCNPELHS